MRRAFLLLLTTFAFVASLFVVPPPAAHAKKGDAAISAARLAIATAQAVKPAVRKAERTPGPATTPRVFAVEPARFASLTVKAPPKTRIPEAPDRSELMVFLN